MRERRRRCKFRSPLQGLPADIAVAQRRSTWFKAVVVIQLVLSNLPAMIVGMKAEDAAHATVSACIASCLVLCTYEML